MVMIRYVQQTDKGWNIKKKLLGGRGYGEFSSFMNVFLFKFPMHDFLFWFKFCMHEFFFFFFGEISCTNFFLLGKSLASILWSGQFALMTFGFVQFSLA